VRAYPDPKNPGYLTDGSPLPERRNRPADRPKPDYFQCEVCKRRFDYSAGYFGHIRKHPAGELARRVEPKLFGDAPAPPDLPPGYNVVDE
jgi:hypothetical protein